MQAIKAPKQTGFMRIYRLFSVLTKYGFEDIMMHSSARKLIPKKYLQKHPDTAKLISISTYERIRLVLEELGPTYVKLGQIFSNREDMIPPELILELEKLQDEVPPLENFEINEAVQNNLKIKIEDYFLEIEQEPIAAASLAQVHKATLTNGEMVVLKVQRPNIRELIEADILVMKQVGRNLEKYSKTAQSFQPLRIIASFEKSIHEELQFLKEFENVVRFAKNFENSDEIYVPKVYRELSSEHILCMEFIDGIKVSNVKKLQKMQMNTKEIAQKGVDLYLKQVLDHGFFHADPHPGNIFILPESDKICFIDFGMMGRLMPKDKELLEDLLLYFLRGDIKKIITSIENISENTSIPDYKKLENDLTELVNSVSNTEIKNMKMNVILDNFKTILYENKVTLPHYLYMLMRALVIMEGVGLKLDPEFNITQKLQPYITKITWNRFSLKRNFKKNLNRFQDFSALLDSFPEDVKTILQKIKNGKLVVIHEYKGIEELQKTFSKSINRMIIAIIIATLSIGSALLVIADMPPKFRDIPILGAIGFIISAILGLIIIISISKNSKI